MYYNKIIIMHGNENVNIITSDNLAADNNYEETD